MKQDTDLKRILYKVEDHVATIMFNRPDAINAMRMDTIKELQGFLERVEIDTDIRCVVLAGAGEKGFCAGGDVKQERILSDEEMEIFSKLGKICFSLISESRLPFIAAIHGYTLGGGVEIALFCDYVIAMENAKIGIPTINLGAVPGWGCTQLLPRKIGIGKAKELLMTGKIISAKEALDIGLVEAIASKEEFEEKVYTMAKLLADKPPLAIKNMKIAINRSQDLSIEDGFELEEYLVKKCCKSEDREEAMDAFLKKRPHREYKCR